MPGELVEIVYLERKMRNVIPNVHRAATVKFADLDFFFAPRRLEENELRASGRFRTVYFLQSEHLFVERDGLFQVVNPVAGVQEFLNHRQKGATSAVFGPRIHETIAFPEV